MNLLRRLSYRPEVIRLIRALGLRNIGRRLYYRWARPADGILRLEVGGIEAQFHVRTPEELRGVESVGGGEKNILDCLSRALRPGDVVYDIGSHVGIYAIFLAKAVGGRGQVIAFEPESQTYDHLVDNVRLNQLQNIRPYRKGLGDSNKKETLYLGEVIGNFSFLPNAIAGKRPQGISQQVVEVVEGDRFVAAENLPLPRAVKIDVEGFEYAVIKGLRHTLAQPTCELICCEIHPQFLPPDVKPEAILTLVQSLGFSRMDSCPRWDTTFHLVARKTQLPGA